MRAVLCKEYGGPEKLVYGDAKGTCFATLRPGLAERTITIAGASKTFAMTG